MKTIFTVILFFSLALFSQTGQDAAVQVATRGYHQFLNKCLDNEARINYGLTENDRVENAELDVPFKLMEIPPSLVTQYRGEENIVSMLTPVETYLFPVTFNGQIKLLMTVDKYEGRDSFEIGSLGYVWLANELGAVLDLWPREKGYNPVLCNNFQTQTYAFHIPEKGASNLTLIDPLSADRRAYATLSSAKETMSVLKVRLAACMIGGNLYEIEK